jgi:hypothetical protein
VYFFFVTISNVCMKWIVVKGYIVLFMCYYIQKCLQWRVIYFNGIEYAYDVNHVIMLSSYINLDVGRWDPARFYYHDTCTSFFCSKHCKLQQWCLMSLNALKFGKTKTATSICIISYFARINNSKRSITTPKSVNKN